jgi:competence protein ComEA
MKQSRQFVQTNTQTETPTRQTQQRVNINTAKQEELERLPTIGKEMAERIIEHRTRYGKFERIEHLLLVRGMSDKKFRDVREFITIK